MLVRWVWLVVSLSFCDGNDPFSVVVPRAPVYGLLGSSVTLPCSISPPLNAVNFEVLWFRPQEGHIPILFYQDLEIRKNPRNPQYQGRVSLIGGLDKGNVSVKLENIRLEDKGEYICRVEKTDEGEEWYDEATVSLQVKVGGSAPVLCVSDVGAGKVNVSCESHGWTSEPSLRWTNGDGRNLKHLSTDIFTKDSEGLVSVSSWLLVSLSASDWLSCSVGFSDSTMERKESRVLLYTSTGLTGSERKETERKEESWKNAFIVTLILFTLSLLGIVGVGVYCVLLQKGLIGSERKKTEGREEAAAQMKPLLKQTNEQTAEQSLKKFKVNLTIDPKETPHFLRVTNREKSVRFYYTEDDHEDLEEVKIFSLCKEKFSSGKQYWEVKLNEGNKVKLSWFVGVASDEAENTYRVPLIPENGFWVLGYDKDLGVHIMDKVTPIQSNFSERITTLGVFLDCDNHTLSFYNAETQSLIYTFTSVTIKTSLRPLISPGIKDNLPITIC